ncbi:tetratricopeptide repeat protein [Ottowia thiooxydans]|uniref:tetratricopeptide repeat protein n=1 Tax=Ottowia thiooxydans TaxID=219182 RepID=UPI0012EBF86E|nr:tetratricopeptide repeat protein [Ottowia thiooxydans]
MRKKKCEISKDPYDLALEAATRSHPDMKLAQSLLEKAHQGGDPRASYALATWYLHGDKAYPVDLKQAIKLLKTAAGADIDDAHFDLAYCYEVGLGIRKNLRTAYRHYLAAALNGDEEAHAEVGRCLYYGIGVNRDRKIADIWLRRADALGVTER